MDSCLSGGLWAGPHQAADRPQAHRQTSTGRRTRPTQGRGLPRRRQPRAVASGPRPAARPPALPRARLAAASEAQFPSCPSGGECGPDTLVQHMGWAASVSRLASACPSPSAGLKAPTSGGSLLGPRRRTVLPSSLVVIESYPRDNPTPSRHTSRRPPPARPATTPPAHHRSHRPTLSAAGNPASPLPAPRRAGS